MAKPEQIFRFTGTLEKLSGKGAWSYVEFPHDVKELYGTRAAVRMKGTYNGIPMDRALLPSKSGYHLIIFSTEMRRKGKLKHGDPVYIEIWRNERPDELEVPEELAETLDFFPEMKAAWDTLTTGMRRGMCIWVGSGKALETRAKRVAELLRRFENGNFQVGGGPDGKAKPPKK